MNGRLGWLVGGLRGHLQQSCSKAFKCFGKASSAVELWCEQYWPSTTRARRQTRACDESAPCRQVPYREWSSARPFGEATLMRPWGSREDDGKLSRDPIAPPVGAPFVYKSTHLCAANHGLQRWMSRVPLRWKLQQSALSMMFCRLQRIMIAERIRHPCVKNKGMFGSESQRICITPIGEWCVSGWQPWVVTLRKTHDALFISIVSGCSKCQAKRCHRWNNCNINWGCMVYHECW